MVNIEHMVRYSPIKDGGIVLMSDSSEIPVARTVKNSLAELIARNTR